MSRDLNASKLPPGWRLIIGNDQGIRVYSEPFNTKKWPNNEMFEPDHPIYKTGEQYVAMTPDGKFAARSYLSAQDALEEAQKAIGEGFKPNTLYRMKGGSTRVLSDTSQPGTAISALAHTNKPAPVFYSALEHAVENSTQNAAPAQQWLGWLKNQPGVKQEELAWTGLPEWLGAQKGKVSKANVQAYLKEHQVEIKDVTKQAMSKGFPLFMSGIPFPLTPVDYDPFAKKDKK